MQLFYIISIIIIIVQLKRWENNKNKQNGKIDYQMAGSEKNQMKNEK